MEKTEEKAVRQIKMDCHMGDLGMHIKEEKHSVVRSQAHLSELSLGDVQGFVSHGNRYGGLNQH